MKKDPRPNLSLLPRLSLVVWEPVEGRRFIICTGRRRREEEVDKEKAEDAGTQRKPWISGLLHWLCLQDLLSTSAWAQLSLLFPLCSALLSCSPISTLLKSKSYLMFHLETGLSLLPI